VDTKVEDVVTVALGEEVGEGKYLGLVVGYYFR
jgi:hypothetical protein